MNPDTLQNRCFDEIDIGDTASISHTLSARDVQLFAAVSGDLNPTHIDAEVAKTLGASDLSGHSMWLGAQVSGLLGNQLPGPGTIHVGQDLEFLAPVSIGEQIVISITVREKHTATRQVTLSCRARNARGDTIMTGTARVIAPDVKITGPALVAINVGTRLGVLGQPLRAENHQAFADALAQMTVVIEVDGKESARAPGSVLMDNPLNSAVWLARALHDEGVDLMPGQVLREGLINVRGRDGGPAGG